jgi:hypothetical protein
VARNFTASLEEAVGEADALGFILGCFFSSHGGLASEKKLRDVGEGDGVATGDALASELFDEIAQEEIHFIGGRKGVNVAEKFGGEGFGVDSGNARTETIRVVGAEGRVFGTVRGTMSRIDQHVAALATGIPILAFRIGLLFWGHRLAFLILEVKRQEREEVRKKQIPLAAAGSE